MERRKYPRGHTRKSDHLAEAGEIVGDGGELGPGRVRGEITGGKVSQGPRFQIPDGQFDHGMLTVLGLDDPDFLGSVGDKAWWRQPGRSSC